jgi:hypothetical protein
MVIAHFAVRMAAADAWLSDCFRRFGREETGHELLCIRDIHALGENPHAILSGHSNPGVWGMVTQCYFSHVMVTIYRGNENSA